MIGEHEGSAPPEIRAPTLMVAGDRDLLRPFNLEDAARIPNCALQVFYRAGHLIPWDTPQAFADPLVAFLEYGTAALADLENWAAQLQSNVAPATAPAAQPTTGGYPNDER